MNEKLAKENITKLLIVDDDKLNIEILREVLESEFDILSTTNGYEAIEIVKKNKIDKREHKINRLLEFLEQSEIGAFHKPTPTAKNKEVKIHPDLYRDLMDFGESYEEIGIENIRDESGKLIGSRKINKNYKLKKEIRILKQEILDIKNNIDDIKSLLTKT